MEGIMKELCKGCGHLACTERGNYCYMFEKAPENLPCGQHDKYKAQRERNGKLLLNNPSLFFAAIMGRGEKL
jgi:hypothetical protein